MKFPVIFKNDRAATVVANLVIFGVFGCAALLYGLDRDAYYFSVQEDQFLEWSSFWAFLAASTIYLLVARQYRTAGKPIWFAIALAAFCFVVALEEISWGQRLLGYQPPDYFLANNYQQELNLHNVMASGFRKLAVSATILGFGLLLPLLALVPVCGRLFDRLAVPVPPLAMAPAFLAALVMYEWYPFKFTGEWVELALGFGFLFASLYALGASPRPVARIMTACLGVILAGAISAPVFGAVWLDQDNRIAAATMEIESIQGDFAAAGARERCGLHKRLYTLVDRYDAEFLLGGEFAGLVDRGLPSGRAEFLLDPWNSPYWLRDNCAKQGRGRTAFVYSFGPNRRRDSSRMEILGDDIGVYIVGRPPAQ